MQPTTSQETPDSPELVSHLVLGIHPGPVHTGLALRRAPRTLSWAAHLTRGDTEPLADYTDRLADTIAEVRDLAAPTLHLRGAPTGTFGPRLRDTLTTLRTVTEALLLAFDDVVVVPAGEHPSVARAQLPKAVRDGRWPDGFGPMQHPRGDRSAVYAAWTLTLWAPLRSARSPAPRPADLPTPGTLQPAGRTRGTKRATRGGWTGRSPYAAGTVDSR